MRDTRDDSGNLLPDAQRLSRVGRILRKTSLDELPELFNVIKGEMSLVGPRPLFERYAPAYRPSERARFRVKPGITGLAQVSGRNLIPWDDRLALDVRYVENLSFRQDVGILLRTIGVAVRTRGVSVDPDLVESDLAEERLEARPE
jgi:lipopolysaccharide/colanic/teichoic acid biosynthesis glycosyltransferase